MLVLELSQVLGADDRLEDREISRNGNEWAGLPALHGTTPEAGGTLNLQATAAGNCLHYLWPGPLGFDVRRSTTPTSQSD